MVQMESSLKFLKRILAGRETREQKAVVVEVLGSQLRAALDEAKKGVGDLVTRLRSDSRLPEKSE